MAAGDGTTSVTVICGALLRKCLELLERGVHPTVISDSFARAAEKASEVLAGIAIPVDLGDRESLIKAANTCARARPSVLCSVFLAPQGLRRPGRLVHPAAEPGTACMLRHAQGAAVGLTLCMPVL